MFFTLFYAQERARPSPGRGRTQRKNVRDDIQDLATEQIKEIHKINGFPDAVAALNLSGDINVSIIVRTLGVFGLSRMFVIGKRNFNSLANVGMQNYLEITKIPCTEGVKNERYDMPALTSAFYELSKEYILVFVEQHSPDLTVPQDHLLSLRDFRTRIRAQKSQLPLLFVMGSEGTGIPAELINAFPAGYVVEIPQRGVGRSLNVATACAVVLAECYRDEM